MSQSEHETFWLRLEEDVRQQEKRPLPQGITPVEWREKTTRTRWRDYLTLKDKFAAVVEEIQPDIVHAGPIQSVALLPALAGVHPLLTMSWGFDIMEDMDRDPIWKAATKFVLNRSDWFTADCHTVRRRVERLGFPPEHITIFPWGIDHTVFNAQGRAEARKQMGYEDDLLIVHTRSWEPRYGVDIMLEGFWRAFQQEPHLRLLMLGGGSQEKMVKRFVQEKGLQKHILFCGYQENDKLAKYYRAADVYLSASHIDGSSVALMESMSCGCPALVSDIPSNLEWIHEGEQGWVFKDSQPQSLTDRILEIARNRNEVARRGNLARAKAEKDADWPTNVNKLMGIYQKMMN